MTAVSVDCQLRGSAVTATSGNRPEFMGVSLTDMNQVSFHWDEDGSLRAARVGNTTQYNKSISINNITLQGQYIWYLATLPQ